MITKKSVIRKKRLFSTYIKKTHSEEVGYKTKKGNKMNHNKINNFLDKPKIRITLDKSVPVKDERPIARLYQLFSCFNKQYGKGAVKR